MSADPLAGLDREGLDVAGAMRVVRDAFVAAGHPSAAREARMLAGHVFGLDLTGLTLRGDRPVEPQAAHRLAALARRRLDGEPVQRLIGSAGFWGLDLDLSAETLVPRPETETLVEAVLARVEAEESVVFADLGVGSGAILIALLVERPRAFGVGVDLAAGALATARANAEHAGIADRAVLIRGSFAAALAAGRFDVIVSNPPYVATAEIETLDREVRRHDPHLALDGGRDGLDAYRTLVPQARIALKPGGLLAVEIGADQASQVVGIFQACGFDVVAVTRDLAGRDRVVVGRCAGGGAVRQGPLRAGDRK